MKKQLFKKATAFVLSLSMLLSLSACSIGPAKNTSASADKIVKKLSLEQKIGQMLMPAFRKWKDAEGEAQKLVEINDAIANAITNYGFGGVILFAENASGTASTTKLINDMQSAAAASETGLPLLMSVDQEGGYIYRLGTGTDTCGNMALGATGDPEMAKQAASIIASELAAEGFNVDFAPTLDANNNPENPVIGVRSYSDDPKTVSEFGSAFIAGLNSQNIASALKHFPGHGDTATDSHSGLPCIDKSLEELKALELIPFKAGIEAGADLVMTAHIQYPQIETETYTSASTGEKITLPATLSKTIITDVLRGELGFEGVVTTDAMNMGAISEHFDSMDAARLAINAGVDILLMPVEITNEDGIASCGEYIQGIKAMVESGEISEDKIDAAVTRILKLKIKRGLLDETAIRNIDSALSIVGSKANHDLEWSITEKAITLVKNDNNTLPIQLGAESKLALFCSYENEINSMNFAIERLKEEGVISDSAECKVLCYQKMETLPAEYEEAIEAADAVIASVETTNAANLKEGWQQAFLDELIDFTHSKDKKIAVISLHLPYDLARYQKADALLAAYSAKGMNVIPAEYNGETVSYGPNLPVAVYAALGGFTPSGKLPVDIPKLNENNEFTNDILYPRGYGL